MIVTVPHPRFFRARGIPYVHFPPYDRQAALTIVGMRPRRIFEAPPITTTTTTTTTITTTAAATAAAASTTSLPLPLIDASITLDAAPLADVGNNDNNNSDNDNGDIDDDSRWLWAQYAGVVWDTYARGGGAARDLAGFRGACDRLWRAFVQPVAAGRVGARDVARLVVMARRALFFRDDDNVAAAAAVLPPPASTSDHHAQTHAQNGALHAIDAGGASLAATARKEAEKSMFAIS
jgi:origin recognition complex subunit 5